MRFQSRYDLRGLVDVAAEVARVAAPARPEKVTQDAYDAARARAGYPDAPSARQTASRLRIPWAEVLNLAFDGRDVTRALGALFGERPERALGPDAIRGALRVVALRLKTESLSLDEYTSEWARMLLRTRRPWLHRSTLDLPKATRISHSAGGWTTALRIADLNPSTRTRPTGITIVDCLELALEAHGALPSDWETRCFAIANNLSVARFEKSKPWSACLSELRTRRDESGKWTPPGPPAKAIRPDFTRPVSLPEGLPQRGKKVWTRTECVAALARVLGELPSNELFTSTVYRLLARGHPDLPALRTIHRRGRFREMVAEARQRRGLP
jgi:hypothetical protein